MARKPTIKFDKAGMRDLEKKMEKHFDRYSAEANKAADRESTAAEKAKAYANVMKKHGVPVDVRDLTKRFETLMNE